MTQQGSSLPRVFAPAVSTPGTGPSGFTGSLKLSIKHLLPGALGTALPFLAECGLHRAEAGRGPLGSSLPSPAPRLRANPQKGRTYPGKCPGCQPVHRRGRPLRCPLCPERVLASVWGWGPPGACSCRVHSTSWAPAHSHWGQKGQQLHEYKEAGRRGLTLVPRVLIPRHPGTQNPGTSGGSKGLHSQSPERASHPGRCHWGPGAGFSSGSLRAEEGVTCRPNMCSAV